ncbi:sirohydrochlorin chelatase [Geminicoccus roseus]|uniref:sirohydrochlorin chelatase n=1 Tax=Geminicoccus roseus TaxID=404900 RepID=UPI0006869072|nr:sirohydrochlorin chelatase [Geminicoccus roseus]
MSRIGVMVCGHGSRDVEATHEFAALVAHLKRHYADRPVEAGYLEFARPVIRDGLDRLKEKGVTEIRAMPAMLFAAGHVKNDVPSVLNTWAAENPDVTVTMARDLAIDGKLLRAAADRIEAALAMASDEIVRAETLLLVVGRGTSDSDANGNVAKVTRMLWEGMGFGHAETGYSGVAHPRTDEALRRAIRLGYKRIVVFPYFLFTGVLVQRIYEQARAVAALHPEVEVIEAGYLNDHPLVVETFVDRIEGVGQGDTQMNCQLCKYRTQILGFEADQGAPQESHHHHVEGIGTDADHHHHHGHHHHHHGHGHGHHHHDHPHEPADQKVVSLDKDGGTRRTG